MITTLEQFVFYKSFAHQIFSWLVCKINKFIIPNLEVMYSDMITFTFAKLRRPNQIYLFIDNIVFECGNGYNKNKICSMIFIALTHELMHVEQVINQYMYAHDDSYKRYLEKATNLNTLNFLYTHKQEIYKLFGVDLDLSYLENMFKMEPYADYERYYKSCTIEEFYKNTIRNVIFRKDTSYNEFECDVLNKYRDIVIAFQNGPNFLIKSNGEFCDSTLSDFISAVAVNAGKYDRYTVNVNVIESSHRDKKNVALVTFTLSDRQIYPMVFKEN